MFWNTVLMVCGCYLAGAMIAQPLLCMEAARESLWLCARVVIPGLFPFFVCSNLLIGLGVANRLGRYLSPLMRPLFGISGSGAIAVLLGVVSGYPVGADCIAGLYRSGNCTKTEAERMLAFCNNSGPMFVMGAVGVGMLGSQRLGILLYAVHLVSALLTGILFRRWGKNHPNLLSLPPAKTFSASFGAVGAAVADGVSSISKVCGFVVVFGVFTAALPKYPGSAQIHALLEITGGIHALVQQMTGRWLLPVVSFFLAFSGISVFLQVAGILQPHGLSVKSYLLGKLTQGALALGLTPVVLGFFPQALATAKLAITAPALPDPKILLWTGILMVFWCFLTLALLAFGVWAWDRWKIRFKTQGFRHTKEKEEGLRCVKGRGR